MNEMQELYGQIHAMPTYTHKGNIKRNMLFLIMGDQIDHMNTMYTEIQEEHEKLVGQTHIIMFNGRKMDGYDQVGELTNELHPSLHVRMEQWRLLQSDTKRNIQMVENWLASMLATSKNIFDVQALLPAEYFPHMERNIESYATTMVAHCRIQAPTLTRDQISQFNYTHHSTLDALRAFELNKLTS